MQYLFLFKVVSNLIESPLLTPVHFCATIKAGSEGGLQNPETVVFTGKITSRFRVNTAHQRCVRGCRGSYARSA